MAVPVPARPTTTSERAPHSTPVSLPAPRMNVPTLALTGLYNARVGIDTKVMTYRIPAVREILLIGSMRRCGVTGPGAMVVVPGGCVAALMACSSWCGWSVAGLERGGHETAGAGVSGAVSGAGAVAGSAPPMSSRNGG